MSLLLLLQPAAATIPAGAYFDFDADHPAASYATLTTTGGLVDQSGNARPNLAPTATASRPTLTTGGANGHAYLAFDGVDDRLAGTTTMLAFTNAKAGLTLAAFVQHDGTTTGADRYVIVASSGGANSPRIALGVNAAGQWTAYGRRLDADTVQTVSGPTADTNVHLLVAVQDYSATTQQLYLDGALVAENTAFQTAGTTPATNSLSFSVGAQATPSLFWGGNGYKWPGYDRALTATEIAQLWSYGQSQYGLTATFFSGTAALSGAGTLAATGTAGPTGAAALTGSGTLAAAVGGPTGAGDVTATAGTPVESTASVTTQAVALPPGLVDGDHTLLICSANGTTPVITAPAGWSALFPSTQSTASTSHAVAVFYRAWQAGDTDPIVTLTSARLSVLPVRIQGADPTTFLDTAVASTSPAAGATTVTAPAQTPATTGRLFVVASGRLGSSGTVLTWSPPPGMTEVGEADSRSTTQSNASVALFTEAVPVGADTGTRTATASSSSTGSRAISFVLKAAPVAAGGITTTGTAVLAGEGTLAAVGAGDQATVATGAADLAGGGTLTAAGTAAQAGTGTLGGSGALTAAGTPAPARTTALTGAGALTTTAAAAVTPAAALSGAGTLTVAGTARPATTVALSGAGALTATGAAAQGGTGTAPLTGSGSLTATGTPAPTRAATLTGSGTLTATPTAGTGGTAALTGTGVLGAVGTPAPTRTAAMTGAGTLTAGGGAVTATTTTLTGTGTLGATGGGSQPGAGSATLTGTGALTTTRTITAAGTASLTGTGTVTAGGTPRPAGTATLTGGGQLAATYTARHTGAVAFTGAGALTTAAIAKTTGVATLTGGGQLTTTALAEAAGVAYLTGEGTLVATGRAGPPGIVRDLDLTVTGPRGSPATTHGPTGRATATHGPYRGPLTITGPWRTNAPTP